MFFFHAKVTFSPDTSRLISTGAPASAMTEKGSRVMTGMPVMASRALPLRMVPALLLTWHE